MENLVNEMISLVKNDQKLNELSHNCKSLAMEGSVSWDSTGSIINYKKCIVNHFDKIV